jgi:hypothetical protein
MRKMNPGISKFIPGNMAWEGALSSLKKKG